MKAVVQKFLLLIWLPFLLWQPLFAQQAAIDDLVSGYVLMDAESGQILRERNAEQALPPASITKLMTAYLTFQALQSGKITLEDKVSISRQAYKQEGSRMFVEINSQVAVGDLIQGMIVQSGNDASVALAEYLGGSVEGFAQMMNQAAAQLGMKNTHFVNPTGMPDEAHYSSARDIALLARAIIMQFPEYYHYYSQKEFVWNKIKQQNRNRLLWRNANVDGLKTGYTDAAGFCLVASEKRGEARMISVVLGARKEEHRYEASLQLLNSGFALFSRISPVQAGQVLSQAQVFKGETDSVNIAAQQTLNLLVPNEAKNSLTATLNINGTLVAPIAKGQVLGDIRIAAGGQVYATVPAVAAEAVAEAGFFKRTWHGLKMWWNND